MVSILIIILLVLLLFLPTFMFSFNFALFMTHVEHDVAVQRLVRLTIEHPLYPLDYSFPSHKEVCLAIALLFASNASFIIKDGSATVLDWS